MRRLRHPMIPAMPPLPFLPRAAAVGVTALFSGCVYLPRSAPVYDPVCRVMVDHLVLEGAQVGAIQHCENQGCAALIVGASVITAATVVVSGSIVIAGNLAYWVDHQARCDRTVAAPVGTASAPR